MEELKAFLIKHEVLEVFCEAVVHPQVKSSFEAYELSIRTCIDHMFNWDRAYRYLGRVTGGRWLELHSEFNMIGSHDNFTCSRADLVEALLHTSTRRKLHSLVPTLKCRYLIGY